MLRDVAARKFLRAGRPHYRQASEDMRPPNATVRMSPRNDWGLLLFRTVRYLEQSFFCTSVPMTPKPAGTDTSGGSADMRVSMKPFISCRVPFACPQASQTVLPLKKQQIPNCLQTLNPGVTFPPPISNSWIWSLSPSEHLNPLSLQAPCRDGSWLLAFLG